MPLAEVIDFTGYLAAMQPQVIGELAPIVLEADLRVSVGVLQMGSGPLDQPLAPERGCVRVSVREDDSYTVRLAPDDAGLGVLLGNVQGGSALLDAVRALIQRE